MSHKLFSAAVSFSRFIGIFSAVIIFVMLAYFALGFGRTGVTLNNKNTQHICHEGVSYLLHKGKNGFTAKLDTNTGVVRCK